METVLSTDKKGRISLNHLLNFTFPQRQTPSPLHTPRRTKVNHQPYNKERFVNANFRFLLNATGDYGVNLADPDCSFDWGNVEQVLISSTETPACPICLSPPTAARVTKCGHIFCLSCILHYFEAGSENNKKQWRKCPICWDAIYERDFKPVKLLFVTSSATHIQSGDELDMTLVQRESGSTLAFPLSATWPLSEDMVRAYYAEAPVMPWQFTPDAMHFARFMLASPDYLEAEFSRDKLELEDGMKEAKEWRSTEDIPFIDKAQSLVQDAIDRAKRQRSKKIELAMHMADTVFTATAQNQKLSGAAPETTLDTSTKAVEEVPMAYRLQQERHMPEMQKQTTHASKNIVPEPRPAQASSGPTTEFFFFQASDGQHVYLHPLDSRVLKHEYGDYRSLPRQLHVKVECVEETSMTEDLRKRFKYLSHLPLACDVTFVQVNLRDHVSEKTYKEFESDLKSRIKRRQEKEKREERLRKAAEARQKKQNRRQEEENRQIMSNDPFFQINQPMSPEENDEMLKRAIMESSELARDDGHGPRTVWGTRAVQAEQVAEQKEWADHVLIRTTRKKKNKRKP
ncbi:hypothetical protein BX666DRAFT_179134 [Dichotomocladium elegans]|nr:hypothetical protein BX666DRAFT_179134 [Dichotomocladium elegans]